MKKKLLALFLVGALSGAALLAGCGSGTENNNGDAAASSSSEGQEAPSAEASDVEEISLTLTTTNSQTETAGEMIQYFVDQLSELSGGKIKVEVFWGGTLSEIGEELSFVGSGAADMTLIGQASYTDTLALLNFPTQVLGGYEEACELMDTIAFDDPDTSAYVTEQLEAQNVKMLTSLAAGSNAFVSKEAYTSLDEMKGKKLGVGMQQSAFEALGFNVVTIMPWDYYDNLSRGIADIGYMSTSALVSMSIQDVTPYFIADGTYTAGNFITINLDKWNAMSPAAQEVFQQAADLTQTYSIESSYAADEEAASTIEAAGGSLVKLSDEDCANIQSALFAVSVGESRNYAASAGCTDQMETVLSVVAEKTGNTLE